MASTKGRPPTQAASRNGTSKTSAVERRRHIEQATAEVDAERAGGEVVDKDGDKVAKVVRYRDLELLLPDKLPSPVLLDVVEFEADTDNMMPMLRLLRSILGQEQFIRLRYSLTDTDDFADWGDLFNAVMEHYGVQMGESSASQDS